MIKVISTLALCIAFASCQTNNNNEIVNECDKTSKDYKNGYNAGHGQAVMSAAGLGGSSNCDTYLRQTNNGNGPIGTISDCWKDGYQDGYNSYK